VAGNQPPKTGTVVTTAQASHAPPTTGPVFMIAPAAIVAFVSVAAYVLLGNFVTGRL
jgi:hypothetical protein